MNFASLLIRYHWKLKLFIYFKKNLISFLTVLNRYKSQLSIIKESTTVNYYYYYYYLRRFYLIVIVKAINASFLFV